MKNSEMKTLIKKHLGNATPNWVIHNVQNLLLEFEDKIKGLEQDTNDSERQTSTEVSEQHDSKALHIADVSVSNLTQRITSELINNIRNKRNEIIAERLKEIVGIELNLEEEAKRRFKRLAIEYNENEETIYFNDGSIGGKRIVTFVRKGNPLTFEVDKIQMSVEYSYY